MNTVLRSCMIRAKVEAWVQESTESYPLRTWSALVLVGLFGAAYVLVATSRYGIGYAGDSPGYFGPARAMLAGEPFLRSRFSVMWPPVYAVFLALSAFLLRMDPVAAARYMNAAVFAALLIVPGAWILRKLKSGSLAVLCSLCLLCSYPLLVMAKMGLSDTLFVLLLVLFFVFFERHVERRRWTDLFLAGLIGAISTLTRYAGVTVVLCGGLFLLLDRRNSLSKKIRGVLLFGFTASLPLLLWVARNWAVSGTMFGERYPSPKPFLWNLASTLVLVTHWFVPFDLPRYPRAVLGGVLFLAAAWVVWRCLRTRALGDGSPTMLRLLLFMGIYLAYLVVSTTRVAVEQISLRYLLPAYVPAVVVTLPALWIFARSGGRRRSGFVMGAAVVWFLMSIGSGTELVGLSLTKGTGAYSARRWSESCLIAHLGAHPVTGPLYSNYPEPIDLLTGIPARRSPRRHAGNAPQVSLNQLEDLKRSLVEYGPAYLAWFRGMDNTTLVPFDGLAGELRLEKLADLADGSLYRMSMEGEQGTGDGEGQNARE